LKIGQLLLKLWKRQTSLVFLSHGVDVWYICTSLPSFPPITDINIARTVKLLLFPTRL